MVNRVVQLTDGGVFSGELADELVKLRDATGEYLKKNGTELKTSQPESNPKVGPGYTV